MTSFVTIAFYSFIAGLSTVVGVYLTKHFKSWTEKNSLYLISFAVGVLLANAFFHLLPEAIRLTSSWIYYTLLGLLFLFFVEHFMIIHACREEECDIHTIGFLATLGIGLHSLVDGIVIGVGFEASFALGLLASFAVIFHEIPEGVFTYTLLTHDGMEEKKKLIYSWSVALATPAGAMASFLLLRQAPREFLGILLALSAGTFIYIGASDLIPQAHKKPNFLNGILLVLGIVFVYLVGRALGA